MAIRSLKAHGRAGSSSLLSDDIRSRRETAEAPPHHHSMETLAIRCVHLADAQHRDAEAMNELDSRRGLAAQKAGMRRILADAEARAATLRGRQMEIETQFLDAPAASWPEAATKARYVLNLTTRVRASRIRIVASVLRDFVRLDSES